jgi:hypothetical protein
MAHEPLCTGGCGVPGLEVKPVGRSRTGVILIATPSPLWKVAREGPVARRDCANIFAGSRSGVFWMAGTGLPRLYAWLSRYPCRSESCGLIYIATLRKNILRAQPR